MQFTDQQIEAISCRSKRILVLACAGSGKTSVIVGRVNRLLQEGAKPEEILALTFSNKAAKEMRGRINKMVPSCSRKINVKTFHAFGLEIINSYFSTLGFSKRVSIVMRDEIGRIIKEIFKKRGEKPIEASDVLPYIHKMKSFEEYEVQPYFESVANDYIETLKEKNYVDMDDMIRLPVLLFQNNPNIAQLVSEKYKYIFVDEYQDTSKAQNLFLDCISGENNHLFLVGDDDQAIYEWRGAKPQYIIEKSKDARYSCLKLEKNFRSQGLVIDVASKVIAVNNERVPKTIQKDRSDGVTPVFHRCYSEAEEADWVIDNIKKLLKSDRFNPSDIAILSRNNQQLDVIKSKLTDNKIAYDSRDVDDTSKYSRFIRVLKSICSMNSIEDLGEALNFPDRCFDQFVFEDAKVAYCDEYGQNLSFDSLTWVNKLYLSEISFENDSVFRERYRLIALLHEAKAWSSSEIIAYYIDYLRKHDYDKTEPTQFSCVMQAFDIAENYEKEFGKTDLSEFVEHLIISYENDDADTGINVDAINVLTIHRAKGLEFKAVFVIGVQVGLFPNSFFVRTRYELECERRLFYVAITRAKELLFFSSYKDPLGGAIDNPVVRHGFMAEIPKVYFGPALGEDALRASFPMKEELETTKATEADAEIILSRLASKDESVVFVDDNDSDDISVDAVLANNISIPANRFVAIVGALEMEIDVLEDVMKKNSFSKNQFKVLRESAKEFSLEKYRNDSNCIGIILGPRSDFTDGIDTKIVKKELLKEQFRGHPFWVDLIDRRITKTSLQDALEKIKKNYRDNNI